MKVLFVGFGNVGQKIAEILFVERAKHPATHSLTMTIVGIVTKSRGSLVNNNGIDVVKALQEMKELQRFSWTNFELTSIKSLEAVQQLEYDVLVELSTLSIADRGEPAVSHVREALRRGKHVVTANKGPAAFAYQDRKSVV
jgi:homoserine dehydrogenase